jgi:DNA-binding MarR family transcriptional regulator
VVQDGVVRGRRATGAALEAELARAAAFRTALRRLLQRTDAVAAQAGLTSQRYDLLLQIRSAGGVRVTELCELLQLRQTAVTELVKRAKEAGLVARRPSPEDGRVSLLRLTAESVLSLLV